MEESNIHNGLKGGAGDFILAVITTPGSFPGEADYLEGLLEAGLQKLHLRKPGAERGKLEELLAALSPRWHSQLVLHGSRELAAQYKIPQIHGRVPFRDGLGWSGGGAGTAAVGEGMAVSTSVHSWGEVKELPDGLAYTFLSPLFDSISKPGYAANIVLLRRPAGAQPTKVIGMGGIGEHTILEVMRHGWDGAAVLGWIWEEPRGAVRRYEQLKKIITTYGPIERDGR